MVVENLTLAESRFYSSVVVSCPVHQINSVSVTPDELRWCVLR